MKRDAKAQKRRAQQTSQWQIRVYDSSSEREITEENCYVELTTKENERTQTDPAGPAKLT